MAIHIKVTRITEYGERYKLFVIDKGMFENDFNLEDFGINLAEDNNQFITRGKKVSSFIEKFDTRSKNKELLADVRKYLAVEKTKILELHKQAALKKKVQAKTDAKKNIVRQSDEQKKIKVGSQVRLIGAKKVGDVIEKDGNEVTVLFGNLKTKLSIQKLRFVR